MIRGVSVMLALAAFGSEQGLKREPLRADRHSLVRDGIRLVSDKQGLYEVTWVGSDGQRKRVTFQAPDRIEAIVAATVSETGSGRYRYHYVIQNLPESGQTLARMFLQTFSTSLTVLPQPNVYTGPVSTMSVFKVGKWYSIAPLPERQPQISPGASFSFDLDSSDPPGLVECRVSGSRGGYQGAVEEMPPDLQRALPGYDTWPHGSTVGPTDRIRTLSEPDRVRQALLWLKDFEELGWLGRETRLRYEETTRLRGLKALASIQEMDLRSGQIAPEVLAVTRTLSR